MSLSDLKPGESGIIKNIGCDERLAKRLFALGLIEGTKIKVKTSAPFGDPIVVHVRGFNMAIRKSDANKISLGEISI
ncbi:ferrous iron transport protein A [Clostridium acidisoli DSM 12555]|uniref:Ferrous iron transport protein A n=1 Tax=Clostridium acidisoli DSM 12555 TaxID=1121291 RepID=A0A1W1XIG2_9CLOT|nr:FeoA family protein [Clostridium acidisoli]SMC23602.1 ferrous iron transport protein A [Clostridium acidisoli DSM 12555]